MSGVQTNDIIARRLLGAYEIRQRLDRGELTLQRGPYTYDEAARRARVLAHDYKSIAWIEDADGMLRMLA
jgi:hypothetical protein